MTKIVLITGGCGFLGSHLVKEFASCGDFDEVRIFDIHNFDDKEETQNKNGCRITSHIGDIRNYENVCEALVGVTSVVHNAAAVDVSLFTDNDFLNDVNVNGTKILIEACIKMNVKYFVYTSTVDVAVSMEEEINPGVLDELSPLPENLLYKGYGQSKLMGENAVLNANGQNGLKTISLRPTVLYGEKDVLYIPSMLKTAKRCFGFLSPMGSEYIRMQQTYAGNAAWAHVCALAALRNKPNVGGKAYYITDDSPPTNAFTFAEPFLKQRGYRLTQFRLPFPFVQALFLIAQLFVSVLRWPLIELSKRCSEDDGSFRSNHGSPGNSTDVRGFEGRSEEDGDRGGANRWLHRKLLGCRGERCFFRRLSRRLNMDPCLNSVKYVTRSHIFSSALARRELEYDPKYDYVTALDRSMSYYINVEL